MKLAIVDVGCGNIGSVAIAFERCGLTPIITSDVNEIATADRVILPGVGAAGFAMERIEALGLRDPLRTLGQPVLGICLGMQLLFERSEEEDTTCLGILPGAVRKLSPAPDMPVPHMGWSKLTVADPRSGLVDGDYVYFAHSFACDDGPYSIATAQYGRPIPAAVRRDNYFGAQFHPERSGEAGARFLKAFLDQ
ncbi:imidazole glycerol phosphate synthase subunit HisH [Allosphingosinicella humi]